LIAIHQLSDNSVVRDSIGKALVRFATHIHNDGPYRQNDEFVGSNGQKNGIKIRSAWYFYHGGTPTDLTRYENGGGAWATNDPLPYGDMMREQRQLNCMMLHLFGYAYKLTGNTNFVAWGDEWFAATFGKGQGPAADATYSLADTNERNYDQCYRSSGRYLAWRGGA
jgi:hypothetical protein